jgi:FkbM family methyltransferase
MKPRTPAMPMRARKLAFTIAATDHGPLIVNRFDRHQTESNEGYGVGFELLESAVYEPAEINMALTMLDLRRQCYGTGVVGIDCGANIGVHTIEWSKHMTGWGQVLAIEAQERIYYALGGNIALNNCFNARAMHAAVTSQSGAMKIPIPNYLVATSFGSLELKKRANPEFIGQPIDYSESKLVEVPAVSLDSLNLDRIDLIKIDVEGMELEALSGGEKCIATLRPILLVEMIKSDKKALQSWLENHGYLPLTNRANIVAIHHTDKCLAIINDMALRAENDR